MTYKHNEILLPYLKCFVYALCVMCVEHRYGTVHRKIMFMKKRAHADDKEEGDEGKVSPDFDED